MGNLAQPDWLDRVLDGVPGNRPVYDNLTTLLGRGSLMAFIGAGASAPLYPLWNRLLTELVKQVQSDGFTDMATSEYWTRESAAKPLEVAGQLRERFGARYFSFLFENFKDKMGGDGNFFTPAHASLLRLRLRAYITTNYDPGLEEARRAVCPDIRETGFAIWHNEFQMSRWQSGSAFDRADCPILHAHGHFGDPQNIVLDSGSYSRAYGRTPYRRYCEQLFTQGPLLFVGFGFRDPVLNRIAEELSTTTASLAARSLHVAILGYRENEPYTSELRRFFLSRFGADVLLYPILGSESGAEDHSALERVLASLPSAHITPSAPEGGSRLAGLFKGGRTLLGLGTGALPPAEAGVPAEARHKGTVQTSIIHEATNDQVFTGRQELIDRLAKWSSDRRVRIIGICGIGGTGKTALVGHWMQSLAGKPAKEFDGVFFWSFYRERSLESLFAAIKRTGQMRTSGDRWLWILDGVEVIQEAPGGRSYGKLIEPDLANWLHSFVSDRSAGVVLMTSRFPFPDLAQYLGDSARIMALSGLSEAEGNKLLENLEVRGDVADRERITSLLAGHPLALRVFARSMPAEVKRDPTRHWRAIFDGAHLKDSDPLHAKMLRLLTFYEAGLPAAQRKVLGLLSLFRIPVSVTMLKPLWEGLGGKPNDFGSLIDALHVLHGENLLTADELGEGTPQYSCHPILRDHFRAAFLKGGEETRSAASMVVGRPGGDLNRQGLEIVCSAIELLLESADVQAANDLYQHRLRNGNLFLNLGAPQLGFEIAAGFLRNQTYRDSIKSVLGEAALSFYLNDGALFATLAGEPHLARRWYEEKIELNRQSGGGDALSVGLQNLGEVLMHQGDLTGALAAFAESAGATGHVHWSLRARILELQAALFLGETGRVGDALRQIPKEHSIGKAYFHTVWLVMCDYHLKLGDVAAAKELSIPDLMPPNNVVDRCMCGLTNAALQYALGQYQNAANSLAAVERESTNGHVVYYLASTLLLQGRVLAESDGTREEARAKCERALGLAAPRGYRLIQCGALLMLATLARRDDESLTVARDQAEAALYLARDCKYVWGEMSANRVLVEVLKSLRDLSQSALAMKRYTALAQRLGYKGASGLVI